ncbi:MAG: FCD domain-containing protein [Paracoccus sp. (in: a-proteobacteria)]|nr:FCD domain-containing protein [Paracoccus sp. (in: a-proteobacteria)]
MALERLRTLLSEWARVPGTRLPPERDLSQNLGISRRALRRALEVLEAEGQIWRRQGSGTFAGPPHSDRRDLARRPAASPANILHVIEARLALEPALARLAASRIAPDALRRIAVCIDRIETAPDIDAADLWDSALHREIAQATGNPLMLDLFDSINAWRHDQGIRQLRMRVRQQIGTGHAQTDHRRILAGLKDGDGALAGAAMRDHLADLHAIFLRYSQEEVTGDDA